MRYKRLKGQNFTVEYPAHVWNELTPEEQKSIAKFYDDTYTKKIGSPPATNGRADGAADGRYLPGIE